MKIDKTSRRQVMNDVTDSKQRAVKWQFVPYLFQWILPMRGYGRGTDVYVRFRKQEPLRLATTDTLITAFRVTIIMEAQ